GVGGGGGGEGGGGRGVGGGGGAGAAAAAGEAGGAGGARARPGVGERDADGVGPAGRFERALVDEGGRGAAAEVDRHAGGHVPGGARPVDDLRPVGEQQVREIVEAEARRAEVFQRPAPQGEGPPPGGDGAARLRGH